MPEKSAITKILTEFQELNESIGILGVPHPVLRSSAAQVQFKQSLHEQASQFHRRPDIAFDKMVKYLKCFFSVKTKSC